MAFTVSSASFTAVGNNVVHPLMRLGESVAVAISGTYDQTIHLQRASSSSQLQWETIKIFNTENATEAFSYTIKKDKTYLRLVCLVDGGGTAVVTLTDGNNVTQSFKDRNGRTMYEFDDEGFAFNVDAVNSARKGVVGANATVVERGNGVINHTRITVTNGVMDADITGSIGVGTLAYTFPAGDILIVAAKMDIGITQGDGNINSDQPDVGLGTVEATGAITVLSGGGSGTFEDIITGSAATNCTGTKTVLAENRNMNILTGGVHTVFFNAADAWAGAEATGTFDGTIDIFWIHLG